MLLGHLQRMLQGQARYVRIQAAPHGQPHAGFGATACQRLRHLIIGRRKPPPTDATLRERHQRQSRVRCARGPDLFGERHSGGDEVAVYDNTR